MLDALKNAILDLLEDRSADRYASYPRLGTEAGDLPIDLLAELGYSPLARADTLPRLVTPLAALEGTPGGWTAN